MSHDQRARGGAQGHGQASGQAAGAAGADAITQGHTAVQLLEGGSLFPRISTWAAHAIETANFAAAREASMRWNINRPYLRTLAQSLDPTDHFVARAQALLDDMAPLEAKLPDLIDLAGSADSAKGKARWLARLGRAEKAPAAQEEAPPPAVHSPLRPENVKSDGLDLGDLAAGALGVGAVLWAEQNRNSINPVEHEAANVITKLTENPAYTSGFVVGGIEGAWAAVKDNAHFIVEIGEFFVDMVKAQIAGGDLGVLMSLRDKVMDMIAAGRQVPAAIKAFADRWNDASNPHAQGHFQGHAVGYMAVQILALVLGAVTPGVQYADVIRLLKLATDPVSGVVELAAAAKAARAAKAAGKVEHAVDGAVAGERAGVKAAEGAAEGERRLGGVFEEASTPSRREEVVAGAPRAAGKGTPAVGLEPRAGEVDVPPAGAPSQASGGRYGADAGEDGLMDILTDPQPTPAVQRIQDEARRRHPDDIEAQLDLAYQEQKTLRREIQARRNADVPAVAAALTRAGLPGINTKVVDTLARYLFDSSGILFAYDNYAAWSRLARGTGTIDDVRFLTHELEETRILEERGVDFMGEDLVIGTDAHTRWYERVFEPHYSTAHAESLRVEYEFLAEQLKAATNGKIYVSAEEAAAFDLTRAEGRRHMLVDGRPLQDDPRFQRWRERGQEHLALEPEQSQRLGLGKTATLAEILAAVKRQPASK